MTTAVIPVNLTTGERETLITTFIERNFRAVSVETLQVAVAEGKSFAEAACEAICNEAVNDALLDIVNKENATPLNQPLTLIWVTFQKEGIHRYPAAATDPNLATGDQFDVSFLANPHRHIFHFRIGIQVFHDDRDIEFIQFKRWLEGLYVDGTLELNYKSCEMIADDLHAQIVARYPGRNMSIDVSEDGENGATIQYTE